jgi:7-keto-8-aminopelargonate synthetase-like enzyme
VSDIFKKFQQIDELITKFEGLTGFNPLAVRMQEMISPTEAMIDGRQCVLLGTNNYLGLTFDEDARAAARATIDSAGVGTTGSRVANGSYAGHQDLEKQMAAFFGKKHAILFTTGYQANLGFISAIAGKEDYILLDSDSHASIYDGVKLGDATVFRFRHSQPQDLESRLKRLPAEASKLVIVEGIYSMLGDTAPLKEIVEISKRYGAYIMVDEAHSLGVLGENGRGLAELAGVEDQVDFIIGTFSKSVGTIGGFCVSNHKGLETMRLAARAYMFTASLPPSVVASAAVNLAHIQNRPELRKNLWRNTDIVYDGLKALGFEVGPEKTPVIGVKMPGVFEGLEVWKTLIDNGVYVNLALPPATPNGVCLLRCSVCAAHTPEQLEAVLKAFAAAKVVMDHPKLQAAE